MNSLTTAAKHLAPVAPALFNIAQTCAYLGGLPRTRIYALLREPGSTFPRQLKLGKTARWRKADLDAWLAAKANAQGLYEAPEQP
jgi:predicted DNA-binding transcriptional regulator AlpA